MITGYRKLNNQEIDSINQIKEIEKAVHLMLENASELENSNKQWLAEAKIDLQKGFMCAIRAIANPND